MFVKAAAMLQQKGRVQLERSICWATLRLECKWGAARCIGPSDQLHSLLSSLKWAHNMDSIIWRQSYVAQRLQFVFLHFLAVAGNEPTNYKLQMLVKQSFQQKYHKKHIQIKQVRDFIIKKLNFQCGHTRTKRFWQEDSWLNLMIEFDD